MGNSVDSGADCGASSPNQKYEYYSSASPVCFGTVSLMLTAAQHSPLQSLQGCGRLLPLGRTFLNSAMHLPRFGCDVASKPAALNPSACREPSHASTSSQKALLLESLKPSLRVQGLQFGAQGLRLEEDRQFRVSRASGSG